MKSKRGRRVSDDEVNRSVKGNLAMMKGQSQYSHMSTLA